MDSLTGVEFFTLVAALGALFAGFTEIVILLRRRGRGFYALDLAERDGLTLSLEFNIFAVVFSLLPFPLFYSGRSEAFAWRLSSMALALFLSFELFKAIGRARRHAVRWPTLMGALVAGTGLVIGMAFLNAIWWSSLAVYTGGLLWIMLLCGVQFAAIVSYEHHYGFAPTPGVDDAHAGRRGEPFRGRLRRFGGGGHPNRAPDAHPDGDGHGHGYPRLGRDPNRYADQPAGRTNGRAVADSAVRRGATGRRGGPGRQPDARG
jgi:hypothetical protein